MRRRPAVIYFGLADAITDLRRQHAGVREHLLSLIQRLYGIRRDFTVGVEKQCERGLGQGEADVVGGPKS